VNTQQLYTHLWINWIHLCQRQSPLPPGPATNWELELLSWWSCVYRMERAITQCLILYPRWQCVGCHSGFDSNFYANQLTFAVFFNSGIATARVICKIFAVHLQICIVHSTRGGCFISLNKTLADQESVSPTLAREDLWARFKSRCRIFASYTAMLFEGAFCAKQLPISCIYESPRWT
jgi:hypothetical protein